MLLRLCALVALLLAFGVATAQAAEPDLSRDTSPWPENRVLVSLDIPARFGGGSYVPGDAWTTFLRWPMLEPSSVAECPKLCPDSIMLVLANGQDRVLHQYAWDLKRVVAGTKQFDYPERHWSIAPPEGYTEAWRAALTPDPEEPDAIELEAYVRSDPAGAPLEFVRCFIRSNDPPQLCLVDTTLDGAPSVELTFTYRADLWPQREAIRAAVMQLVNSWRR